MNCLVEMVKSSFIHKLQVGMFFAALKNLGLHLIQSRNYQVYAQVFAQTYTFIAQYSIDSSRSEFLLVN